MGLGMTDRSLFPGAPEAQTHVLCAYGTWTTDEAFSLPSPSDVPPSSVPVAVRQFHGGYEAQVRHRSHEVPGGGGVLRGAAE